MVLAVLCNFCCTARTLYEPEEEEEEEEEEDLFVFNDTIEGPRAPAVKLTQGPYRLVLYEPDTRPVLEEKKDPHR